MKTLNCNAVRLCAYWERPRKGDLDPKGALSLTLVDLTTVNLPTLIFCFEQKFFTINEMAFWLNSTYCLLNTVRCKQKCLEEQSPALMVASCFDVASSMLSPLNGLLMSSEMCVEWKGRSWSVLLFFFYCFEIFILCSLHHLVYWRSARRRTKLLQETESLFTYYWTW